MRRDLRPMVRHREWREEMPNLSGDRNEGKHYDTPGKSRLMPARRDGQSGMKSKITKILLAPIMAGFWSIEKYEAATTKQGYTTWWRALFWFLVMGALTAPMLSPIYALLYLTRNL